MKRVLFVATLVKKHINVFHIPYFKWFKEQGWETSVCARNDFGNEEECNIPFCDHYYDMHFERFPLKKNNIKTYKQLKRLINNNAYDIIHCHTPTGALLARLAARKARKKGTRVIYTAHGFHFFEGAPFLNWMIYYPIEKICARFTDVLITINQEDYSHAQRKFKAKRVGYISGVGVDIEKFADIEINREEKRKEIGVPTDSIMLLSVGELNKNKNHQVIICAMSKLDNPDVHYVIAGVGKLESNLKELAKELGVEDRLHLLGYRKDVGELCKAADIFCFPSLREGLPVSLIEAMAARLPCVVSNVRGNSDLIEEGKGGFLCKPTDVDGFADEINRLRCDETLRNRMGDNNLLVVQKYDLHNTLKEMERIYKYI